MHSLLDPLSLFVNNHSVFSYGALFLGAFLEGEIMLIMAGVMVHLGVFPIGLTVGIVALAAASKTLIGYYLGVYIGRKFPNSPLLKYFERRVFFFLPRFKERPFWSIVLSKCIYGVNNATLVFAGYVGADFKTYLKAEAISSVVWFGGMFGLGLFFSTTALSISHNFRNFGLLILLFIIGFMILLKVINLVIELLEEWGIDTTK